jgi:hypothetical protein
MKLKYHSSFYVYPVFWEHIKLMQETRNPYRPCFDWNEI